MNSPPDSVFVECLAARKDLSPEELSDLVLHLQEAHGLAGAVLLPVLRVVQGRVPASGLGALRADPRLKAVLSYDGGDPFRLPLPVGKEGSP